MLPSQSEDEVSQATIIIMWSVMCVYNCLSDNNRALGKTCGACIGSRFPRLSVLQLTIYFCIL